MSLLNSSYKHLGWPLIRNVASKQIRFMFARLSLVKDEALILSKDWIANDISLINHCQKLMQCNWVLYCIKALMYDRAFMTSLACRALKAIMSF